MHTVNDMHLKKLTHRQKARYAHHLSCLNYPGLEMEFEVVLHFDTYAVKLLV